MNKTKKGYINIHIDIVTLFVHASAVPYNTREEAEKAVVIRANVQYVGCFEIEYTDIHKQKCVLPHELCKCKYRTFENFLRDGCENYR